MAACLGCRLYGRDYGRHDGAVGEIMRAASGALAVLILLDGEVLRPDRSVRGDEVAPTI